MHAILEGSLRSLRLPRPFTPAELETEFLRYYSRRYGKLRQSANAIGLLTWIFFLFIDVALIELDPVFAAAAPYLLAWHVAGTFLFMVVFRKCFMSSRFTEDERYASQVTLLSSLAVALIIFAKQFKAPYPYDYIYYFQGIVVLLMFCFSLYRMRANGIVRMILFVVVLQLLLLWYHTLHVAPPDLTSERVAYALLGSTMLLTISIIGYGIGVQFERAERQTFANERKLQSINDALAQRNQEVERLKRDSESHMQALLDMQSSLWAEAEQRNRDKSKFLASAVHDLRQPLQAISNALYPISLSLEGMKRPAQTHQLLDLMKTAAETMRRQLSAILNLSRLESGLIRAEVGPVWLDRVIASVIAQQQPIALTNGVNLEFEDHDLRRVIVQSDSAFVERILLNLIDNGIKYRSRERSEPYVRVTMSLREGHAVVGVEDNGLGMDESVTATGAIFEPFFQANNAHPENERGVGLGLSIVRAMIANLAGHAISVKSRLGHGSRFELKLPLSDLPGLVTESERIVAEVPGQSELSRRYVLLVEDDPLVLRSTMALFDVVGIRCEAYESYEALAVGLESLERIPDVLLSDFRLPNQRTAFDVINVTRKSFPDIGVVIFSGEVGLAESNADHEDIRIISKPLAADELLQAIADCCIARES